jgi:hypothetical protein
MEAEVGMLVVETIAKIRRALKISRRNADLSESARYALSLAKSCLSAAFPALLAAAMV